MPLVTAARELQAAASELRAVRRILGDLPFIGSADFRAAMNTLDRCTRVVEDTARRIEAGE